MTLSAPPRSPSPERTAPDKPLDRAEVEALVEALIEEVRRETRRRHRRYWAFAALVAFVGAVVLILLDGGAASQTESSALSTRSSLPIAAANSHIAFISEPDGGGYCGLVYVINPDGGRQRQLWQRPPLADRRLCPQDSSPAWSPDGRKIAMRSNLDGYTGDAIYVMNADGSEERALTGNAVGWAASPAWSPDGRTIAFTARSGSQLALYRMSADGTGRQRLLARGLRGNFVPAWSPDGRRVAFVSGHDGNFEISVVNADGSRLQRLTHNVGRDSGPAWSPDGRRIVFVNKWQVYVMNADGSGRQRLTRNGGRNVAPAWSPDGQTIAFERRLPPKYGRWVEIEPATYEVWSMNANGGEPRLLARNGAQPVWSPDGRKIAFARQCPGSFWERSPSCSDIYVMNADGSETRNLTRGAGRIESSPIWSPALR